METSPRLSEERFSLVTQQRIPGLFAYLASRFPFVSTDWFIKRKWTLTCTCVQDELGPPDRGSSKTGIYGNPAFLNCSQVFSCCEFQRSLFRWTRQKVVSSRPGSSFALQSRGLPFESDSKNMKLSSVLFCFYGLHLGQMGLRVWSVGNVTSMTSAGCFLMRGMELFQYISSLSWWQAQVIAKVNMFFFF